MIASNPPVSFADSQTDHTPGKATCQFKKCSSAISSRACACSSVKRIVGRPLMTGALPARSAPGRQLAVEKGVQRGLVLLCLRVEPVDRVNKREEGVERGGHLAHFFEDQFRALRLGDLGVGQPLDDLHRRRGAHRPAHQLMQQQRLAPRRGLVDPAPDPRAEQAVAVAQVMVEEAQRRADGEGMEPQRDLASSTAISSCRRHRRSASALCGG